MPFEFATPFPETDPECVPRFTRSFEHIDWIDGASVVQAETTPTEEGFNSRFRKIIGDLDAVGDDARRALLSTAAMRTSLFAILNEIEAAMEVEGWRDASMLSGWSFKPLNTDDDFNRPGFRKDRSGVVHLRGTLGNGPIPSSANGFDSIMFNLPAGYRPGALTVIHAMTSGDAIRRLDIEPGGNVNLRSAYSSWVSLDGVSFAL